jgi:hypothetical protein
MGFNPGMMDVAEKSLRERYEPALQGYAKVSFHVLAGVVGVELLRFARRNAVDQIVLPAAAAQKGTEQMAVSLQSFLLERSPCPVLLVSPGRDRVASISRRSEARRGTGGGNKVLDLLEFRWRSRRGSQGVHRGGTVR